MIITASGSRKDRVPTAGVHTDTARFAHSLYYDISFFYIIIIFNLNNHCLQYLPLYIGTYNII